VTIKMTKTRKTTERELADSQETSESTSTSPSSSNTNSKSSPRASSASATNELSSWSKRIRGWTTIMVRNLLELIGRTVSTEISAVMASVLAIIGGIIGLIAGGIFSSLVLKAIYGKLITTFLFTCTGSIIGVFYTRYARQRLFRFLAQFAEDKIRENGGSETLGGRSADAIYEGLKKADEGHEPGDLVTRAGTTAVRGTLKYKTGKNVTEFIKEGIPDYIPDSIKIPLADYVSEKVLPNAVHEAKITSEPTRAYKIE